MDLQNYQQKIQKIIEEDRYPCPSFNSYSSNKLAEIAARVTDEFKRESSTPAEFIAEEEDDDDDDDDDDFEFSLVPQNSEIAADELFCDGQIGSVFPVFNRNLLLDKQNRLDHEGKELCVREDVDSAAVRIPLKNSFLEEKENHHEPPQSSSSSSEADELEAVPPGTYCVWRPKKSESFPIECKKSSSTGSSSKRWKLRHLLRRINSEGNDSYVFLTPKKGENSKAKESGMVLKVTGKTTANMKSKAIDNKEAPPPPPSKAAHERLYLRNDEGVKGVAAPHRSPLRSSKVNQRHSDAADWLINILYAKINV